MREGKGECTEEGTDGRNKNGERKVGGALIR